MDHPLYSGFISSTSPVLFANTGTQKVELKTIRLLNQDSSTRTYSISLFCRGVVVQISNGVGQTNLDAGESIELLDPSQGFIIDPGCILLGTSDLNNKISVVIDGKEYFEARSSN